MTRIDAAQIGEWFEAFGPRLRLYARQWVGAAAADDVVQDAFVGLLGQRIEPGDARAWLFRAVRNAAISRLRSRRARRRREAASAIDAAGWFDAQPGDLIDAHDAARLITQLPDEQREIVVLRIWGELTFAEIATVLDGSVSTVFRRYEAGLSELRRMLEQTCRTHDTKTD